MSDQVSDIAEAEHLLRVARLEAWPSVVPARFHEARLTDLAGQPPPVRSRIEGWAAEPDGRNLILGGPVGVGKTHAAVAACRGLWADGTGVEFWPVVELLDELRPGGPAGAMARLASVDVLIIDDLGSERATDWTAERLYGLVNRRWLQASPIVATSNLDKVALIGALGERVYSRLAGSEAVGVRLAGSDRRRDR
jgi:DNA replication protein DnaC